MQIILLILQGFDMIGEIEEMMLELTPLAVVLIELCYFVGEVVLCLFDGLGLVY